MKNFIFYVKKSMSYIIKKKSINYYIKLYSYQKLYKKKNLNNLI